MIFSIKNLKNRFLTILYRFFGYDAHEQKYRSRNSTIDRWSQNLYFHKKFIDTFFVDIFNRKNLFLTIFYRFFGYDVYEQ